MTIDELIETLEKEIPQKDTWTRCADELYGECYILDGDKEVKKVLYCVTADEKIKEYFFKNNYDFLIAHHPFRIMRVPMFIAHTAFDCCKNGLNDIWKDILGLKNATHIVDNLGWIGELEKEMTLDEIIDIINKNDIEIAGGVYNLTNKPIKTVAVCSGLGGMIIDKVEALNPDCYITGELLSPKTCIKNVIEVGHTNSERIGVLTLRKIFPNLTIDVAPKEIDVFGKEMLNKIY